MKMGTWLGVTTTGRFAALTNYRNPKEESDGKRSRGELVADFLKGIKSPRVYISEAADARESYPGYNLLAGDTNELYYYSNIEDKIRKLEPGIYGVSNHLLNTEWPKVKRGKAGLANILSESDDHLTARLFTLLYNTDPASDDLLPSTGVSLEWERLLSPIYIRSDSYGYGTRSSTVLLMTDEVIWFRERVYPREETKDRQFTINIRNRE